MANDNVPLVDLKAQLPEILDEIREGLDSVIANTAFVLGPAVKEFEASFARLCDVRHCAGVGNGTDALELALRALGVGPGDEVVVPTNSFIASALAIARAGATPVLVDSDPVHHMLDLDQLEARIGERTRAVMPVHLYGQCAPMERVREIADARGVAVVEDAAQSQGARRHGKAAGSLGRIAGTSFYPGKNLGAFGDGGAVVTDDDELAKRVVALRNYGSDVKYHHPETGFNSRLDTVQAVVLNAKLKRLEGWNQKRREAAARYHELLAGVDAVTLPETMEGNDHIWHLYVIRVPERDRVLEKLHAGGIGAGIHYPVPIHLQGAFAHLGHSRGDFPVAEKAADEILSLPLFPEITPAQQQRVAETLRSAL